MCQGVYYRVSNADEEIDVRVHFSNPTAKLPVKTHEGVVLLPWGRRKSQAGLLPLGGRVHLDAIYSGRWEKWFPIPVKLIVKSFMQRDIEGHPRWHDLTKGKYLQGLVARNRHEQRVYVVTVESDFIDTQYEQWPRIIATCSFN